MDLIWLVPVLPLAGFVLLILAGRRLGDPLAGIIGTATVAGSFAVVLKLYFDLRSFPEEGRALTQTLFEWLPAGSFQVDMGFLFDPLSAVMCLFVTGVGALIHLYSIGYMRGDPDYPKFFAYLNLFVASMLVLVLGDNLVVTFLGWEGVGACSYLLISFWFTSPSNASAGKKAFVTNRIGDLGYMIGTFLVFVTIGGVSYTQISQAGSGVAKGTAVAIALLFFLAATGKSAQLPLFVWLPDAMAGPTPVSALIHAATMVTSGIFLLVRLSPILAGAGWANDLIAWVGVLTAFLAACAAVAQSDIKKVLAYSTISQLGFMFLAVGTANYVGGVFHMVTHAFFKALLFLGAGSIIYSMAHEQDMRRYGRLRRYLPVTFVTVTVGWLAISGVPPFSGFWSKDEILAGAWGATAGPVLYVAGLVTAVLTAFYMTRLMIMTFFGSAEQWRVPLPGHGHGAESDPEEPDDDDHGHHELDPDHTPVEAPATMLVPLVALAGLAVLGGLLNLPFAHRLEYLGAWLEPVIQGAHELPGPGTKWILAIVAIAGSFAGLALGYLVYQQRRVEPERIELDAFAHAFYIDETYARMTGGPGEAAFQAVADADATVVDGAVDGVAAGTRSLGERLRPLQSGLVRTYALGVAGGTVLLLVYVVVRMNV